MVMVSVYRFVKSFWQKPAYRFSIAVVTSAFLGVAASHTFIGSVAVVEGTSMMPNYPPGARLYAVPIFTPLDRGDVVLLDDGKEDYAVKRIVGLPGETVQLWRGAVFINRKLLVEPYLSAHTYTFPIEQERRGATIILGDRQYFMLGDNRFCSLDSRAYGTVVRSQIKKHVLMPNGFVGAYFGAYTLPKPGETVCRRRI